MKNPLPHATANSAINEQSEITVSRPTHHDVVLSHPYQLNFSIKTK